MIMAMNGTSNMDIRAAVNALKNGGLVAFPTETVYGLGADAESDEAVRKIFAVKGRPSQHPLIVHFANSNQLALWAKYVPDHAWSLAEAFWPGPLTLILKKTNRICSQATGGLETVGLRVPSHPLALSLLEEFGGAVAAPSANRFGRVSPTTAEHVRADLGDDVDLVLDGGASEVGIESTIVDLSSGMPTILRHGGITQEQLAECLHNFVPSAMHSHTRHPGQHASHYAPRAQVVLASTYDLATNIQRACNEGLRAGAFLMEKDKALVLSGADCILLPNDPRDVARVLYASLREADRRGWDLIFAYLPTEAGIGRAIADRLRRAATPRHVESHSSRRELS